MEIAQRHLDPIKTISRNENREALQVMTKQGIKMITPSKDQIEEFKKLSDRAMTHPGKTILTTEDPGGGPPPLSKVIEREENNGSMGEAG